jgi:hypothetical protein
MHILGVTLVGAGLLGMREFNRGSLEVMLGLVAFIGILSMRLKVHLHQIWKSLAYISQILRCTLISCSFLLYFLEGVCVPCLGPEMILELKPLHRQGEQSVFEAVTHHY